MGELCVEPFNWDLDGSEFLKDNIAYSNKFHVEADEVLLVGVEVDDQTLIIATGDGAVYKIRTHLEMRSLLGRTIGSLTPEMEILEHRIPLFDPRNRVEAK